MTQQTDVLPVVDSPQTSEDDSRTTLLRARDLHARSRGKNTFGPLDLDLSAGDICIACGAEGSGKSTLLLALSGRFRRTAGSLEICGIDAIAEPHRAKEYTAVARLGSYVALEDRLTVGESITERAYLDGIALRTAEKRVEEIEEHMGYTINRDIEIEELPPLVRLIFAITLVALRPAAVIVADDADAGIPPQLRPTMYALLRRFAELDGSAIVLSCLDDVGAPEDAVRIYLEGGRISELDDIVTPISTPAHHNEGDEA
ncbi:MAG: ATP-binding cassette domain-containing protein [Actinomycetaceae bacterium]|nr:ATP-binding cassette domain-containing protein [Actinomycetaceae bacterium]